MNERTWLRSDALKAIVIAFLLGLLSGAVTERFTHACVPFWSIAGLLGDEIDASCIETGTSTP